MINNNSNNPVITKSNDITVNSSIHVTTSSNHPATSSSAPNTATNPAPAATLQLHPPAPAGAGGHHTFGRGPLNPCNGPEGP